MKQSFSERLVNWIYALLNGKKKAVLKKATTKKVIKRKPVKRKK